MTRNQNQYSDRAQPILDTNRPNNMYNNNHNSNFARQNIPQFSSQPMFPNQPINVQSRPIKHFPTNPQVFGKPKNVFQLTGQKPTNEPEPMSTTSRNPTIRQSARNQFLRSGRRNFISKELYQIEDEQCFYNA